MGEDYRERLREEVKIDNDQFGFMPGRCKTDDTFALRRLSEIWRKAEGA